jgi:peptidoglycan/xylan/chitin deacetylase (PgdA/CDA1 family)
LTFDDAYVDFEEHALPVLVANGQVATIYAAPAHVGGRAEWDDTPGRPGAPLLDWAGIERVLAAGSTVGAHGLSHRHLTQLDDAELDEELTQSRAMLEARLGVPVTSLAYPFGDQDARVHTAAARAGYETAVTTTWGVSRNEPLLALPRIFLLRDDSLVDFAARVLYGGDARGVVLKALSAARSRRR